MTETTNFLDHQRGQVSTLVVGGMWTSKTVSQARDRYRTVVIIRDGVKSEWAAASKSERLGTPVEATSLRRDRRVAMRGVFKALG